RSKGHWDVAIRPEPFDTDRVEYEHLEGTIESAVVRLRGWPVPMVDYREPWRRGKDWVGQDVDALMVSHLEAWRFFSSGQFVQLRALTVDWGESNIVTPRPSFGRIIPVWEILFFLTELLELAARLTLKMVSPSSIEVSARLGDMAGRGLVVGQHNRAEFFQP